MFLNYTVIANVPIVILGIVAAILSFVEDVTARKTCGQVSGMHPGAWLLVQAAAAAFFIVFAVRIFVILSGKSHRDLESGRTVPCVLALSARHTLRCIVMSWRLSQLRCLGHMSSVHQIVQCATTAAGPTLPTWLEGIIGHVAVRAGYRTQSSQSA